MINLTQFSQYLSSQTLVCLFLGASLLFLPISPTAKSIFVALSLITIVLIPVSRVELLNFFKKKWCQAIIFFFCIVIVACFWSPANYSAQFSTLEKYSKFLYIPILAVGFSYSKVRTIGLHTFLLAILITAVIAILTFHGYLQILDINPQYICRNHIVSGFMSAFAAYLSLLLCDQQKGLLRDGYILLFIIYSYYVLFVNSGRTGYVIYLLLILLFILQTFSWKRAVLNSIWTCVVLAIILLYSPIMRHGVKLIFQDIVQYRQNVKDTSIGYRLQLQQYAHALFNRHPVLGNGTGSFAYYYGMEKPIPSWNNRLKEPQNQYWLIAAEFGLVGVGALLFLFISLCQASWGLKNMRPIAFAVLLTFFAGSWSDSILFVSSTGYLFVLFMALCLGEQVEISAIITRSRVRDDRS